MKPRPIHEVARDIKKAWPKVHYSAVPYLEAMGELSSIQDSYGQDSAASILRYFLSNAASFRGPEAKLLKAELNQILNQPD